MNPDKLWLDIHQTAITEIAKVPQLSSFIRANVLQHETLAEGLAYLLANKLANIETELIELQQEFESIIRLNKIDHLACADIYKLASANPACPNALSAFTSFKGVQAFQLHRLANWYWHQGKETFAVLLQNWGSALFDVDIHPAATIGSGLFIDHAMGIVIGETAVVEDDVSIWHGVTLGSTFAESGDRHPKIRRGAVLAAGAKILGNIEIGESAVIAAGSVVLKAIPAGMVAAGVPAKVIKAVSNKYAAISE